MIELNQFYSTYTDAQNRHPYDLPVLPEEMMRVNTMVGIIDRKGVSNWFNNPYTPTSSEDYDNGFLSALIKVSPIYKIKDFIEHHYMWYSNDKSSIETELFIDHIKYVILPKLKPSRLECAEIMTDWLQKKKGMLLQKQLQEKNEFLRKAYEAAYEYSKSSPLSVTMPPIEFGASIGFDKETTTRIVMELVSDRYLTSGLGMKFISVTNEGLRYLHRIEQESNVIQIPPMNLSVGNNSTVQFQSGTVNSNQTVQIIGESGKEDLLRFIQEVKTAMPELIKHLDTDDSEALQTDIEYLEKTAKKDKPNMETAKTVLKGVGGILKKVTEEVLTAFMKSYLKAQGLI